MSNDLSGSVALITGGARGQGRAHVLAFARGGADIALRDACRQYSSVSYLMVTEEDLAETARQVRELGRRVVAVGADVTRAEELHAFAEQTVRELGRIDHVLANAGIWSVGGPMRTIDETKFDETIAVDLKGAWPTVKYTVPHLLDRGSGSIVLTSSGAATTVNANISHYTAAKAGVLGLMKVLAAELAPRGIRVNALPPGIVNTDMIFFDEQLALFSPDNPTEEGYFEVLETLMPLPGRWTEAEDQAEAALWLSSDSARLVTGIALPVDGGNGLR
jgi:SDR family mycofactocin-dependent oxidoreductase